MIYFFGNVYIKERKIMLKDYVVKVVEGKDLSKQEAAAAMDIIMNGQACSGRKK